MAFRQRAEKSQGNFYNNDSTWRRPRDVIAAAAAALPVCSFSVQQQTAVVVAAAATSLPVC